MRTSFLCVVFHIPQLREFDLGDFYWSSTCFQVKDPEVTVETYLEVRENPPPVPPTRSLSKETGGSVSNISLGIPLNQESIKGKRVNPRISLIPHLHQLIKPGLDQSALWANSWSEQTN